MWNIHAYSGTFMHIQTYPDIIRHIQTYSGIIQMYSEPCVTLAYSELWRIQNPGIFKTRGIQNSGISKTLAHSEPETYSESWPIQNPEIFRTGGILRTLSNIYDGVLWKTANGYNTFASSQYQLCMYSSSWNKYDFLNAGIISTPEVFIPCKKV